MTAAAWCNPTLTRHAHVRTPPRARAIPFSPLSRKVVSHRATSPRSHAHPADPPGTSEGGLPGERGDAATRTCPPGFFGGPRPDRPLVMRSVMTGASPFIRLRARRRRVLVDGAHRLTATRTRNWR